MDIYYRNRSKQKTAFNSFFCDGANVSVQLASYQRFIWCKLFHCRVLNATTCTQVRDQVLSSSIMLHCSLVLILLCICYVKRFGLRTHCWRWGCLWHLTAQRAYSQSLPLWTARAEEIHLRHCKHFITAVSKICRPQFSLSCPVSTPTYHSIITIFAVLHCHEVFLYIDRCSWESSKFTFYSISMADKLVPRSH